MLKLNETIRVRRRALGMTQQLLAARLDVSAAAVSKWEMGASYPDVTILPALARALDMDLNTLMGFEREPDKSEIHRMLQDINETAKAKGIDAAIEHAKESLREYPTCGALLFSLAATLEGRMMMAGVSGKEKEKYAPLLEDWYLRAAEGADRESREAAAHLLAAKYIGRGEADRAQAMMDRLPGEPVAARWTLEVSLLLTRGENDQAKKLLQNTLFRRAGDMQQILLRMEQAELDEGNLDRAQKIADLTQQFVNLLCMHPYTGHLARLLPALRAQDERASLVHIRAMLASLETQWAPGECLPYDHANVKKGGHADMLAGIIRELRESEEYAFLRKNPGFIALLADHTQA